MTRNLVILIIPFALVSLVFHGCVHLLAVDLGVPGI